MTTITLDKKQLGLLVKESVKEAINLEFKKLRAFLIPYVSIEEQKEIEQLYKKPSNKVALSCNIEI